MYALKQYFGGNFKDGCPKSFPRTRRSWPSFTDALASPLLNSRRMSSESLLCSRLLNYPQKPPKNFSQHTFLLLFSFCNPTKFVFAAPFAGLVQNTGKFGFALLGGRTQFMPFFPVLWHIYH